MTPTSPSMEEFDLTTYLSDIDTCLIIAKDWGFAHGELIRLFGIDARAIGSPERLKEHLRLMRSYDIRDRCAVIKDIDAKFAEAHLDQLARREILSQRYNGFGTGTLHAHLAFGTVQEMAAVAAFIRRISFV